MCNGGQLDTAVAIAVDRTGLNPRGKKYPGLSPDECLTLIPKNKSHSSNRQLLRSRPSALEIFYKCSPANAQETAQQNEGTPFTNKGARTGVSGEPHRVQCRGLKAWVWVPH